MHRGGHESLDVSADLTELGKAQAQAQRRGAALQHLWSWDLPFVYLFRWHE